VTTMGATACAAAREADAGAGAVILPAQNPMPMKNAASAAGVAQLERPLRTAVSARTAQTERPVRKGLLSRESGCAASTAGGSETATGGAGVEDGTGIEDGTGTAALSGAELAAGVDAGSNGLAATASSCSGSTMGSASTKSCSATGSSDADPGVAGVVVASDGANAGGFSEAWVASAVGTGGTWRTAPGRGGGFDVRVAGGGAVDSGRGGSRGWRCTALRGTGSSTAGFVGGSPRPLPEAVAMSLLRATVEAAPLLPCCNIAANARTLRACGGGRCDRGKHVRGVVSPVTAPGQ
jgi:hypothetical protein